MLSLWRATTSSEITAMTMADAGFLGPQPDAGNGKGHDGE